MDILSILIRSLAITGFVFTMMLFIEYVNVQSKGVWKEIFLRNKWRQYLLAGLLGAIPGCLGAFTAVTLFSHHLISFGTIVTTMIATSGDEAFVMFAMFPQKAALLIGLTFLIGILAGYLTDRVYNPPDFLKKINDPGFKLHDKPICNCFQKDQWITQITHPTPKRLIMIILVLLLFIALLSKYIAADSADWIRYSLLIVFSFALFVMVSAPDHFLEKHIWEHIFKTHIPRIFLWTFGTLLIISFLLNYIHFEMWLNENWLIVLALAVLIGFIPESGPHMVFVTMYADGILPFSLLLASSISQDGHGMLPLLAESKKAFLSVKIVNGIFATFTGLVWHIFELNMNV